MYGIKQMTMEQLLQGFLGIGMTKSSIHFVETEAVKEWDETGITRGIQYSQAHMMHSVCFERAIETLLRFQNLQQRYCAMEILQSIRWSLLSGMETQCT